MLKSCRLPHVAVAYVSGCVVALYDLFNVGCNPSPPRLPPGTLPISGPFRPCPSAGATVLQQWSVATRSRFLADRIHAWLTRSTIFTTASDMFRTRSQPADTGSLFHSCSTKPDTETMTGATPGPRRTKSRPLAATLRGGCTCSSTSPWLQTACCPLPCQGLQLNNQEHTLQAWPELLDGSRPRFWHEAVCRKQV